VSWHVLIARTETPKDVVEKLHNEMRQIWAVPANRERVAALELLPIDIGSTADMRAYIKAENDKWGALVRKLGLEASQ
jgi:tripartite-type tricarboxylate transporter receptor subunit TctC